MLICRYNRNRHPTKTASGMHVIIERAEMEGRRAVKALGELSRAMLVCSLNEPYLVEDASESKWYRQHLRSFSTGYCKSPCVMLHGLLTDCLPWSWFLTALAARIGKIRVAQLNAESPGSVSTIETKCFDQRGLNSKIYKGLLAPPWKDLWPCPIWPWRTPRARLRFLTSTLDLTATPASLPPF